MTGKRSNRVTVQESVVVYCLFWVSILSGLNGRSKPLKMTVTRQVFGYSESGSDCGIPTEYVAINSSQALTSRQKSDAA